MSGAIPRMVNAVNRTLGPLDVMFDGQPVVLKPGYKRVGDEIVGAGPGDAVETNALPYFAAEMCKRQHPVMGTEDPEAPNVFESLVGIMEWGDPIDHIEQSDAEERLDRELLDDEAQSAKPIRRRTKNKRKGARRFSDARLKNPTGIRAEYAD